MNPMLRREPIPSRPQAPCALRIEAPGRLHIGFLDLNGSLGRRFGSLGVALDEPTLRLRLERADAASASGPDADRALRALEALAAADPRFAHGVRVEVEAALPAHAGLGSGTQLALAVGVGASALAGRPLAPAEVARIVGRGARSSIGLGAFEGGGVLLDGGQPIAPDPRDHRPPPLISRVAFPDAWRVLLMLDGGRAGLSGEAERDAMGDLPEFPESLSERLCRLTLMGAMPAAAVGDADAFGRAVGEIQRRLGDHFARFQGGRFTSPDVAEALAVVEASGVPGVGQSSWGPTGFAIFGDAQAAERAAADLRARFGDRPNLAFHVVRGTNRGATLTELTHPGAAVQAR
jgi:beta-ribofuranosylaminobenzene 5'-phosphate synthase